MEIKFTLLYSETSRNQIKRFHPKLKPIIRVRLEQISADPHVGKALERELSGYRSCRTRRYRIIYRIIEDKKQIEIHFVGHRRDIYELYSEQLRQKSD